MTLLLFGVTYNSVYNDAFPKYIFLFNAPKCIVYISTTIWPTHIRLILLILDFNLGTVDNRKDYLQTWGEFYIFIIYLFFTFSYKNRNTGFAPKHWIYMDTGYCNSFYFWLWLYDYWEYVIECVFAVEGHIILKIWLILRI